MKSATGCIDDARGCWIEALAIFDSLGDPQAAEVRGLIGTLSPALPAGFRSECFPAVEGC